MRKSEHHGEGDSTLDNDSANVGMRPKLLMKHQNVFTADFTADTWLHPVESPVASISPTHSTNIGHASDNGKWECQLRRLQQIQ